MEIYFLSVPVVRQREGTAIRAGVVVQLANERRVVLKCGTPGIARVLINLIAIALYLEQSRYGEVHPLGVIELQREEILRSQVVVLHEVEAPLALH